VRKEKGKVKEANGKFVLGVLIFFLCVPLLAQEEPLVAHGDFILRGSVLVQYLGDAEHVVIPANLGITAIGDSTFVYTEIGIISITIPASVTSIGERVFIPDSILTTITVDDRNSVYSSSDGILFDKNKTTLVRYPSGKKENTYTIPDTVTSIGSGSFYGCDNLTAITIPLGVIFIGSEPFSGCVGLVAINVDERNSAYSSSDGVLFDKNKTTLVRYPSGKRENTYTIPDTVTSIESGSFYGCRSFTSIIIPGSVTAMGSSAFYGCRNLTSIIIPDSVTAIGSSAFYGCQNLKSITLPPNITAIKSHTFSHCRSLASITMPLNITTIGERAFFLCENIINIAIPSSVVFIENYAFFGCKNLASITIPLNITVIEDYVFSWCESITSVIIPGGVTSIGEGAFLGCTSLSSVTMPDTVTVIRKFTFSDCKTLTDITIPANVTTIEELAFSRSGLSSITIPPSVSSIGDFAFMYTNLKTVVLSKNAEIFQRTFPSETKIIYHEDIEEALEAFIKSQIKHRNTAFIVLLLCVPLCAVSCVAIVRMKGRA
jgi:hypothetical protein